MNVVITKLLCAVTITICIGCGNAEDDADISYMQDALVDTLVGINENGQSKLEWDEDAYDMPVNSVPIIRRDGVRYITVCINGVMLDFVFDTGASYILIPKNIAEELYKKGQISHNDSIDICILKDASNNTLIAQKVLIKKITIGTKNCYDVEACVAESTETPLLLGMSVLEKFAKVSIDNKHDMLILE